MIYQNQRMPSLSRTKVEVVVLRADTGEEVKEVDSKNAHFSMNLIH